MNPKHWAWWILPMFGILAGWIFRTSEEFRLPHPRDAKVETRLLVLPDGRAMHFLRGPSMSIFLSQTEVPGSWTEEFQSEPLSHTEAKQLLFLAANKLSKQSCLLPLINIFMFYLSGQSSFTLWRGCTF